MPEPKKTPAPVRAVTDEIKGELAEYDQGSALPVPAYAATLATYGATVAGLVALVWRKRKGNLPEVTALDVGLIGVATYKLARVVSKDAVTSPLRAPFTTYRGRAETPAEVNERPRGRGARRVVGELLTCPFCLSQWVGTAFTFGFVLAPRATRLVAGALTAISTADFLQFAYVAAEKRADVGPREGGADRG
jgi:hypothetical protein